MLTKMFSHNSAYSLIVSEYRHTNIRFFVLDSCTVIYRCGGYKRCEICVCRVECRRRWVGQHYARGGAVPVWSVVRSARAAAAAATTPRSPAPAGAANNISLRRAAPRPIRHRPTCAALALLSPPDRYGA
uniref:Uncharacterized protein n=1 Tax=Heliothis virescens TaxID=7102 RepID=A0A2A4JKA3_HELVI